MLRITCFALLLTLVAVSLADINTQWKAYKATFGKSYNSTEELIRKAIFAENVKRIDAHNALYALGQSSYKLGTNQMSDMTPEEIAKTRFGLLPTKSSSGIPVVEFRADEPIPESIDWSTPPGKVAPVKNQGQCGSCWAFADVAVVESRYAIKYGQLKILSEQHLLDCSSNAKYGNAGCNGGYLDSPLQYTMDNGGINEAACYPYIAKQQACQQNKSCNTARLSGYEKVQVGSEEALQHAVVEGPVAVGIYAGDLNFNSYKSGIYAPITTNTIPILPFLGIPMPGYCDTECNHAVLFVGYGTEGTTKYWKAKNSWGENWGENGYFRIIRGKNACGITSAHNIYPIIA